MLEQVRTENSPVDLPFERLGLTPKLKSIYYPNKRYGEGFEGVTSRLEDDVSEVKPQREQDT